MTAPSPICTVKDGSGSAQSTLDGVDVTPANTVTIALATTAGADVWTLTCIGTDETSVAATVTSGLTINQTTKTATFTAPAAGKSYLFRSTVRSSGSSDSYSATFKVCTLVNGNRVAALGETVENSSTHGWIAIANAGARVEPVVVERARPYIITITDGTAIEDLTYETDRIHLVLSSVDNTAPALISPVVSPSTGSILDIIDGDGGAGSNSILYAVAGGHDVRGVTTITINTAWGFARLIFDGSSHWHVVGSYGCTFT